MSSIAKKRNGYIEILRFLFAVGILLHHITAFYPELSYLGGYIGVEFFFILSGVFLGRSLRRDREAHARENIRVTFDSSLKYLKKRVLSLFPYFVLSTLIGFAVNMFALGGLSPADLAQNTASLTFDFMFLQELGFSGPSATGTNWFLSALFIALFILYPIIRKWYDQYVKYIGALVSLALIGLLMSTYNSIGTAYDFKFVIINSGVLRAVAMISLGAVLNEIAEKFRTVSTGVFPRIVLTLAELGLYALEFWLMHFDNSSLDAVEIVVISAAVLLTISQKSYIYGLFNNPVSIFLGKMSMVLFMNHFYWAKNFELLIAKLNITFLTTWYDKVIAIIVLSFATSLLVYLIMTLIVFAYRVYKEQRQSRNGARYAR